MTPPKSDLVTSVWVRMHPDEEAVIVLGYYEDLTEVRTAVALGISVGTVKSQTDTR